MLALLFPPCLPAELPYHGEGEEVIVEPLDPLLSLQAVIPGVPGEDYPIYSEVPQSDFSCEDRVSHSSSDVSTLGVRCKIKGGR